MSRATAVVAIWGACLAMALLTARFTKVGPILFAVSHRHGVHAGDVLAFVLAFAVAMKVTPVVLRRWSAGARG